MTTPMKRGAPAGPDASRIALPPPDEPPGGKERGVEAWACQRQDTPMNLASLRALVSVRVQRTAALN
jgi:hypothetical protein